MIDTMKLPENIKAYFQRQGKIGAAKRQEVLTPEQRSEIARMAAEARWANQAMKNKAKSIPSKKGTK